MAMRPPSTQSLLELLDLFEQSNQAISDAEGQRLHGVPGWEVFARTSLTPKAISAWTECTGYAGMYPAHCGDERIAVELEPDDESDRYRYRCPETFRNKYVTASEAAVYAVSASKILNHIATLLDIPQALRRKLDTPAMEGVLWQLGDARIGPARTAVWFARGLSQSVDAVFRHFQSTTLPEQGLILSSGLPLPEFVRPPRNYRFATMRQVLVDYVAAPSIDMTMIHRILTSPADGTLPPVLAVYFDEGSNVLTIRTKKDPWHIKGQRQAAAVRYMYEQAQQGRWEVDASEILAAAYPERRTEESRRGLKVQDLFKHNENRREFIANPTKGKYAFNLN